MRRPWAPWAGLRCRWPRHRWSVAGRPRWARPPPCCSDPSDLRSRGSAQRYNRGSAQGASWEGQLKEPAERVSHRGSAHRVSWEGQPQRASSQVQLRGSAERVSWEGQLRELAQRDACKRWQTALISQLKHHNAQLTGGWNTNTRSECMAVHDSFSPFLTHSQSFYIILLCMTIQDILNFLASFSFLQIFLYTTVNEIL